MPENLDEIIDDATMDTYDISEQVCGFQVLIEDAGICPFSVKLLDQSIKITQIKVMRDRLVGVYRHNKTRHTIDLLYLELNPKMKGYQYLAAYKKWSGEK